jgi:outer membrane protein TolC
MYSQPLPWPGKRKLAGEEVQRRAEQLEAERVGRARLAIEARVRRAYYDLALADALSRLLEERRTAWREIGGIARERYAAGLSVQQDALRAQVELLRLDEIRAGLGAQTASRRAELNRLLRRPADQPLENPGTLELRPGLPALVDLTGAVRVRSPELAAQRRAIEAEKTRVARARKDFLPDFTVSAGPMYRGDLDPMWQAGVGMTLPVFSGSRQGPLLAAAREELKSAQAQEEALALELEFRTRERWQALSATLEIARLYAEAILPVDEISLDSAVASYRAGKVPFVTVLEALNAEGMAAGGRSSAAAAPMRSGAAGMSPSTTGAAGTGSSDPMGMR